MTKIGKTIYILNDKTYIHCDKETLCIELDNGTKQSIPYNIIQQIIIMSNTTLSSYAINKLCENNIAVSYVSPSGKYLGKYICHINGNIMLRKKQFDMIGTERELNLVRNFIGAKLYNQCWLLSYFAHHNEAKDYIYKIVAEIKEIKKNVQAATDIQEIRLLEAAAASKYFSCFDYMLKQEKNMAFEKRSQHPGENNVNALLNLLYTVTISMCSSALCVRGLDDECGYLHTLRSGRCSLACDLVEEFRACVVDRFVISAINRKEVLPSDFVVENGLIKLSKDGKRKLFQKWESYLENTTVTHKLYDKKMSLKYLFYEQAQLLAQYIRGDIPEYPPFLMKE